MKKSKTKTCWAIKFDDDTEYVMYPKCSKQYVRKQLTKFSILGSKLVKVRIEEIK